MVHHKPTIPPSSWNNLVFHWISFSFLSWASALCLSSCLYLASPWHQCLWFKLKITSFQRQRDSYSFWSSSFLTSFIIGNFLLSIKTIFPPVEYFAYITPFLSPSIEQKDFLSFGEKISGVTVLLGPTERFSVEDGICTIASFETINIAFSA